MRTITQKTLIVSTNYIMKNRIDLEYYSNLLILQKELNTELQQIFEKNKTNPSIDLSKLLIVSIEYIVARLNSTGYSFGRIDYSGDIHFEKSEQSWSDGNEFESGGVLHFHGFSCQVSYVAPEVLNNHI